MSLAKKIKLIDRKLLTDDRGWFLKVMTGFEENLPNRTGEIYLSMALPGKWKANHYHLTTSEWFSLFAGKVKVVLEDILTKERLEFSIDATEPKTLFVPPGVAHLFINESADKEMVLLVYSENTYDPADTVPYDLTQ